MATLTVSATLTYGDTTPDGAVPSREPLTFSLSYTESSCKTVQIPANTTDFSIELDTVSAPKFLFAKALDTDVTVKLSDGVVVTPTPTSLAAASGWIMLANPNGQAIKELLVTTPVSPASGARVKVLAFE
jgi:hypothetical protein